MKKLILANFIISLVLIAIPPYKVSYSAPIKPELSVNEFISLYASKYGISENTLLKVAKCESNLKPNAINYHDGGKGKHSFGVMQFQKSTFDYWETKLGEDLDYYSYHDQIKLASYMFSKGQIKQWTCGKNLV